MLLAEGFIHEMLNCYFSQFHDFLPRISSGTYEFNGDQVRFKPFLYPNQFTAVKPPWRAIP